MALTHSCRHAVSLTWLQILVADRRVKHQGHVRVWLDLLLCLLNGMLTVSCSVIVDQKVKESIIWAMKSR